MAGIHLLVIFVLVLFVRAAAIAFTMTGLDKRTALFQALSTFSGTGFTTHEAESIVNHPVRRKIAILLMLMGTCRACYDYCNCYVPHSHQGRLFATH